MPSPADQRQRTKAEASIPNVDSTLRLLTFAMFTSLGLSACGSGSLHTVTCGEGEVECSGRCCRVCVEHSDCSDLGEYCCQGICASMCAPCSVGSTLCPEDWRCHDLAQDVEACGVCDNNCYDNFGLRVDDCIDGECGCAANGGSPCATDEICSATGCEVATCNGSTCVTGCCDGNACRTQDLGRCGIGGNACTDCTALSGRADVCNSSGLCVCAATGTLCDEESICETSGCEARSQPTIEFGAMSYTVAEGATVTIEILRKGPVTGGSSAGYVVSGGTAILGLDFTMTGPNPIVFAAGETRATLSLTAIDGYYFDPPPPLTVAFTLWNITNATAGATDTTWVTLEDNDPSPCVPACSASERCERGPGYTGMQCVPFCDSSNCSSGCCQGTECMNPASNACGLDGATCLDCTTMGMRADVCSASGRCVCAGAGILCNAGFECAASGCIEAGPPTIGFSATTYSVTEGSLLWVPIVHGGASAAESFVDLAVTGGNAVLLLDYTIEPLGRLQFVVDELSKSIGVVAADDLTPESNETLLLTLSNPFGASLTTASATITIVDNDAVTCTTSASQTSEWPNFNAPGNWITTSVIPAGGSIAEGFTPDVVVFPYGGRIKAGPPAYDWRSVAVSRCPGDFATTLPVGCRDERSSENTVIFYSRAPTLTEYLVANSQRFCLLAPGEHYYFNIRFVDAGASGATTILTYGN